MDTSFRLWPQTASTQAQQVDALFIFLLLVSAIAVLVIATLIVIFAIKYRRQPGKQPPLVETSVPLEIAWTAIPFGLMLVMFGWGAGL
jgi:cytochrome c oxidase subunit 2